MKNAIALVILILMVSPCLLAGTDLQKGNGFWERCNQRTSPSECMEFFAGMSHGTAQAIDVAVLSLYPERKYDQFDATRKYITGTCLPKDATFGQTFDVFLKYLKDNPQERTSATGFLYLVAMRQAFPCVAK